jgi:hypothetical protein
MKKADLIFEQQKKSSGRLFHQVFDLTLIVLLLAGCGGAPAKPTASLAPVPPSAEPIATPTPVPPTAEPTASPTTGTITGRVLHDTGLPIKNTNENETLIVTLLCTNGDSEIECLDDGFWDLESRDAKVDSICEADDTAEKCLIHLGQGATAVDANGNYTIVGVPPGEYGLGFFVIVPGNLYFWGKYDVESVQAGKITKYDIVAE